ncbi:heterodisulfide reductase-related iron-sulfur binding cluster [Deinococcus arenicola]|uniref:Heterodisulfide reductase-related iron-sulfur binding cluster n=1 Tax=Deinococcus arenicola TaxID=2994950 RepID=A0ABU4DNR1_9DEIO|nr:heterodisulfide reductase-related iron-sulfur binding cluster [Deinococcus sp. ZS9-10]MDV6374079.1 heterodisulfide reductase-related iron-sulfur binding cluster [Deinococcus sp. ZS9-10]
MLPLIHQILFFIFAVITGAFGLWGFYRLYLRIRRGAPATERRFDIPGKRILDAVRVSLTQERTFRRRTTISVLHSFIFYGFVFYLLVNVVDGLEGYLKFGIYSDNFLGAAYNLLADVLSFLVLFGVVALVVRRLFTTSKRDFRFTEKTLLHPLLKNNYILRDSLIVSAFIFFHVGSRVLGNAAKVVAEGGDGFQPFSNAVGFALFGGLSEQALQGWRIFGFWGALGSVLAFLAYFPYTKHIHIFMAPLNYTLKRPVGSGVLPPMKGLEEAMDADEPRLGVEKLEELEWPRLLDAYACIQCNRCQDVCPANATGKALSPAALEINKRMELNVIASHPSPFTLKAAPFESGASTAHPLLHYAISEEAVWACTTCGACMEVCPVQDEQMLDIIDIRRQQVMVAGEFPQQLQTAFRGMERASNPWGISRDKRMEWAEGLKVPTIDENAEPDVIYWVGCAAAYDPGAQKVARSFVQLLDKAGVNYAVLGKKEACTGDSARRAGNEFLYQTLAQENVETLNSIRPKLIVATCPHCMNIIGNEYPQIGGNYKTVHHTEYLETLVAAGKLPLAQLADNVTYHDPCYLGRHNGVYDAPRNLITKMAGEVLDLERQRENSFCCGAGGAQFWKEEEEGRERISDNRFRELQERLDGAKSASDEFEQTGKVVAVGCPFCKAMLNSTPEKQKRDDIVVKDVAELMLESMQRATGEWVAPTGPVADALPTEQPEVVSAPNAEMPMHRTGEVRSADAPDAVVGETSADVVNAQPGSPVDNADTQPEAQAAHPEAVTERKAWKPTVEADSSESKTEESAAPARKSWKPRAGADEVSAEPVVEAQAETAEAPARKAWKPKAGADDVAPVAQAQAEETAPAEVSVRKAWNPKAKTDDVSAEAVADAPAPVAETADTAPVRKAWKPQAKAETVEAAPAQLAPAEAPAQPEPAPSGGERKKWTPKAKTDVGATQQVSAQAEVAEPEQISTPVASPNEKATEQPAQAQVAPASAPTERPKWQPKAKAAATPVPEAVKLEPVTAQPIQPEPANETPITEHVHLAEVSENSLEEGQQATSEPDNSEPSESGRKKWVPKKKD